MSNIGLQTRALVFVTGLTVSLFWGVSLRASDAKSSVIQGQDSLELSLSTGSGITSQERISINHTGAIRYFSTGIGVEERAAVYPPFALKLVFVEGSKTYLSSVSVSITDSHGHLRLNIPRDQVNGPWLYIDLPPGTYDITAVGPEKAELKEQVTIAAHQIRTVYLRWKKETA